MDMELELTGVGCKGGAAAGQPVARLSITGLASTPVDHDTKNNNTLLITGESDILYTGSLYNLLTIQTILTCLLIEIRYCFFLKHFSIKYSSGLFTLLTSSNESRYRAPLLDIARVRVCLKPI